MSDSPRQSGADAVSETVSDAVSDAGDGPLTPENVRGRLGARIRWLRGERGLSQGELAGRCGVHVAELSKWERGKRGPSLEGLVKLAEGLGVTLSELVDVDDRCVSSDLERLQSLLRGQPEHVLRLVQRLVWAVTSDDSIEP